LVALSSPLPSPEPFKGAFVAKNTPLMVTPHLTFADEGSFFFEGAQPALDQEWALASTLLALDLPNPFEDLDPGFIYRR